ncbi:uncharacterized membrane-anchored protein YhcB (DUF1043 family) [Clostridium punense]|uniref:Uncharacterized membrane-anchored protein YhcB (DUF1043 family) n=1 Tax=Clostridium punense TaxID=1054297 RepID=A0ABS4K8R9_9CLOT|nr:MULTISPECIES: DUF4342 domain-containing protein [Clostridium]EQB88312.1 hypothetical protein M918_04590 [Clostridium sp. BL8]MBP2023551.1 uncharacterized membrane-anchored protein YhcB (DUF1043 family) [Clostridium punense]
MSEITLEKIDIIRERANLSYSDAKELLEKCNGDVVDALIYHEKMKETDKDEKSFMNDVSMTVDEFIAWLKDVVKKGNVTRIKVKKDEKTLVDIPVNAGLAIGLVALLQPILLMVGAAAAIITKLQIEITKEDGSVEVVNKIIKSVFTETKEKANDMAQDIKDKFNNKTDNHSNCNTDSKENEVNTFTYTVKFEEEEKKEEPKEEPKEE